MSVIARLSLGTLLILSTFVADLAYAAKESSVELTPIIGYRFGGDFQLGRDSPGNPTSAGERKKGVFDSRDISRGSGNG